MKKNNQKGITLIYLDIIIIIMIILASTITLSVSNSINKSKLTNFVNDIYSLEDALKAYYIQYGKLPSSGIELKKDELNTYQSDSELYNEITKNNDATSSFYILDVDKINASVKEDDVKNYVFSYPNFNVYYLKGNKINKVMYYSITDKINENILKESNVAIDNSVITLNNGTSFKVTYDGSNFKNTLDITLEYDSSKYTLGISVVDISNNTKTFFKTAGEKSFDKATDIDSTLSSTNISKIKFELKSSSGEVVASETIDTSNYDPFLPTISNISINNTYTDMNTVTFTVSDSGISGISKVMYEYIESTSANKTAEYMKTKAKVIDVSNISNGKASIKVPKDVKVVQMVAIDNAGNISSNYYASGF